MYRFPRHFRHARRVLLVAAALALASADAYGQKTADSPPAAEPVPVVRSQSASGTVGLPGVRPLSLAPAFSLDGDDLPGGGGPPADDPTPAAPQPFTNSTAITITDCPSTCTTPQAASVYPSNITVSGVVGPVQRVSVTLNNFSHAFPGDVDILLVSPTGRKSVVMSDFAGSATQSVTNIQLTLDDYAATPLPPGTATGSTGFALGTGSFRPSNSGTTDVFPAPAPAGPYTYTLSAFNGDNPNGTWSLYVVDDANFDGGQISGGWTITFDVRPPAPAAGDILISEFRTRGVGTSPPASDGSADEFIELYNNTDQSVTIIDAVPGANAAVPNGAGWRLSTAQGTVETAFLVIPQTLSTSGPVAIPPRGHLLITTQPATPSPAGNTYSLGTYPTGTGVTASGTANISINPGDPTVGFLPDAVGLAVFSTALPLSTNRLDSVGFSSVTHPDYREGTALTPPGGIMTASQHSWVRRMPAGVPQDTDNNAADFVLVEPSGGTIDGVAAILGAPGPERAPTAPTYTTSSAPITHNSDVPVTLVDQAQPANAAPNRVRDLTPVTNGAQGTIKIRRRFTNNTGRNIIALRYRVVTLTTLTGGTVPAGQADIRVLNSPAQTITLSDTTTVNAQALTLQATPAQPNGGGLNSSLSEGVITTAAPLANGASTVVEFNLGVQTTGLFRFYVNVEALTVLP